MIGKEFDVYAPSFEPSFREGRIAMSRRGENIYRRKDGRWEGRFQKGRRLDGKIKYGSVYGHTYTEVKQKLYPLKVKYASLVLVQGKSAMPFYQWIFKWLDNIQSALKPSTYSSYRYKLEHYILPYLGELSVNEVTANEIQELVNSWTEKQFSPGTIQVIFQLMRRSFDYAVREGLLVSNPCTQVFLPQKRKQKVHALNKQEQKRLEVVARKAPKSQGLPTLLALQTGMRIGEIAALKWHQIDFETNTISVEHTYQRIPFFHSKLQRTKLVYQEAKTNASKRVIPMTKEIRRCLQQKKKNSKTAFVFSSGLLPCEPRLLTYHFHKLIKKADITGIHFHQLRHTFATRCLEKNYDVVSVSALLGHSSAKMTLDIYADSLIEQRLKIIQSLEN